MISANLVKDLREKTGAGMMDCKKALVESNGDFEAAIDWLRTKGLAAAAKKVGRVAAEGLTAVCVNGTAGAIIELNSETDFVARNEKFQNLVSEIAKIAVHQHDLESLNSAKINSGKTVASEITEHIATIGENLNLRRMSVLNVADGVIASYVHNNVAPNLGKISVIVALESTGNKAELDKVGKQIAMHIAAVNPKSLDTNSLDQNLIERERSIFSEQAKASGKPDNIVEKMVEGRIRKFYEEVVLLEQIFVIDGKTKISDIIDTLSKAAGAPVKLKSFVRFELGEGIEVEETNFADEVASVIGK